MAIQGKYIFKGLEVDNSYIRIANANSSVHDTMEVVEKTAAVYNSAGTLKTAAVMEDKWSIENSGYYTAFVYANKATRDASPKGYVDTIQGTFVMDTKASAKNPVIQAYGALKALDAYSDYTDV